MSSWKSSQIDLWLGDSRTNKKTSPIRKLSWPNKRKGRNDLQVNVIGYNITFLVFAPDEEN